MANRDYRADHLNLDYSEIKDLEKKLRLLPNKAEYEVNNYLWSEAGDVLEKGVYDKMPRSQYKKYGKPRSHAKDSDSLEIVRYNLGVKVQTNITPKSKDFGYLIFPNEGRGVKQKNKGAQEFFEKSLESNENKITNGLLNHLNKVIEEEI